MTGLIVYAPMRVLVCYVLGAWCWSTNTYNNSNNGFFSSISAGVSDDSEHVEDGAKSMNDDNDGDDSISVQ